MTDADLIADAKAGDARALDALVTRYEPLVYRFGYRLTGNADDAAEVAQETLIAMTRALKTFRGDSALTTWLYTVARRLAIRKHRQRAARRSRETSLEGVDAGYRDTLPAGGPSPEASAAARETAAAIDRALAALKPAQRDVVVLRDMEGLTAPEVAKILRIGVRAVKSRLHRARLALRAILAPALGIAMAEPKPGCRAMAQLFSSYLDGDLSKRTCADLEAHFQKCQGCADGCKSLARILAVCRQAPARDLPAALDRSLRRALRDVHVTIAH